MKKKTYQQPRLRVIEMETTEIICTSNEHPTGDDNSSGSSTESLTENDFAW